MNETKRKKNTIKISQPTQLAELNLYIHCKKIRLDVEDGIPTKLIAGGVDILKELNDRIIELETELKEVKK
jgi:hypothetical protein